MNESQIPTATVTDSQSMFRASRMWWATLGCLALAVGLTWWSLPEPGTEIRIHFDQGYGLQAEDPIRFRGVDVGHVDSVELSDDLQHVDATVVLHQSAKAIAKQGSRFWVVRPDISLAGVSGLDAAIGHKYIAVSPGDSEGPVAKDFFGVSGPPVDVAVGDGIELTLRGDGRYSVSPGSVVTFRGVEVGRVLDVGLSNDSRYVDVRIRIASPHDALVTTGSRFWASSGVDVDFSFRTGVKVNTESLDTIARGGVSFLTTGQGEPATAGEVFELFEKADPAWSDAANGVRMTSIDLRGAVSMKSLWQQTRLFITSARQREFNGIAIAGEEGTRTLSFPADVLQDREKAVAETFVVRIGDIDVEVTTASEGPVVTVPIDGGGPATWIESPSAVRQRSRPEKCVVARAGDGGATWFHLELEPSNLRADDNGDWSVLEFDGDAEVWHGAPVLADADGKLLGMLLVEDDGARVVSVVP